MYVYVTHGMPLTTVDRPRNIEALRRHEIMLRTWEDEHLFDEDSHYRRVPTSVPTTTPLQRVLAHTFYNPVVSIRAEWKRIGDFAPEEVVSAVKARLDGDDDIVQQWFDGSSVLKLLTAAAGWGELVLAVEAIGGGHQDTPEVADYVKRVLGRRS